MDRYDNAKERKILAKSASYFSFFIRPSRSGSEWKGINGSSAGTTVTELAQQVDVHSPEKSANCTANWIPYTFSHTFMGVLSLVTFGLSLTVFLLWWRSSTTYGLGSDNGSSAMLFGWRYSPTMIAVIYVQMTAVLLNDIKRTEPFARLARPEGANAEASILHSPGPWWVVLYDGFATKKNGRRSWVLICSVLLNIIGFLAISSLSSDFLESQEITVPKLTDFLRLSPLADSPLPIDQDRATYFRTIANLLQNVSTSPWITDEYTILPFWPASLETEPINTLPTNSLQVWQGETTIFKSKLSCTEMSVDSEAFEPASVVNKTETLASVSVMWSSTDGCKYGVRVVDTMFLIGGGSWSNTSTFFYAGTETASGSVVDEITAVVNHTAECDGREVIVVTEPWKNASSKGTYSAYLCDTKFYMANITAKAALDGDVPDISFNESEYEQNKVSIPETLVNTTQFQDLSLNADWATYMISIIWAETAEMGGAAVLLGAPYSYNMTELVRDPDLIATAAKVKQRHFGEVIQSALIQKGASHRVSMQGTVDIVETRVVVQDGPAIALGILLAISLLLLLAVWWLSRLQRRPLNLHKDPATVIGIAYLIAQNMRARSGFLPLRQPSKVELQKKLGGEVYSTDFQGLCQTTAIKAEDQKESQSENGTPMILRLPALLALVLVLALVIVGVAVLYHYAENSRLYGESFVYQVRFSFLSSSVSSLAPFSMIPTVIATLLGLWWGSIDDNFRHLQPYLSLSKSDQPFKKGVDMSYQSSFWIWAAVKALCNKHWLLFLVSLGSTLSPICESMCLLYLAENYQNLQSTLQDTTTMSALFNRGSGNIINPITIERQLEVRDIPFVFETEQALDPLTSNDYIVPIVTQLFTNISSYWMYTATIQLTLNGSEPAWSKDGWSFVPIDLSNITSSGSLAKLGASQADDTDGESQTNVTFTTPAIRGRISCSEVPLKAMLNITNWLTPTDVTNHTIYNQSTIPKGFLGGYRLGTASDLGSYPALITPLLESQNWTSCLGCTSVFVNPSAVICCGNETSDSREGPVGIGYWSPNANLEGWSSRDWQGNFSAKWFHGDAITGIEVNDNKDTSSISNPELLFIEPPSFSMINCLPIIEQADATVTVNPQNSEVLSFNITSTPKTMSEPWADSFVPHNISGPIDLAADGEMHYNVTLSFGRLFTTTMLTAADTLNLAGTDSQLGYSTEDLSDNSFNIRDKMNGLNMDFMTYAMYTMAGNNASSLLDPDIFTELAEKTFTTFFQHFVSKNLSMETGGWAYQKINASLPVDLGPAVEFSTYYDGLPGRTPSKYQDVTHPISHTNRKVAAQVSQRVELLQMNAVAVWLSIGIMSWLILTAAVVAILQKRYFGKLVRNVECLGDVLVLIAGSVNFLEVVRGIEAGNLAPADYEHLLTRLGWFLDEEGELRWGIEMLNFRDGPGEWVSRPQFRKKDKTNTWTVSAKSL
ncbi:hypothetical protein N7495_008430 [Penicillium taxi]|uniref:uncharacterized protein n=1 Tax=Penicillium taxi TaxID=168475 RepID=UPI002544EB95|nr:uncharacterized protein N7495_008430 [Penicillium taxi]KAJ5888389.1 hypothetical protein N7495_008430 [Penicillium taxi]